MFSNAYQSGPHVDVFDSKVNKDKNQFYAALYKSNSAHGVKKEFDKLIKSYLFELEGQTTKLIFPKDDHKELCLVQQYLVLQIFLPQGFPWSLQLTLTDTSKTKRRVNLTTAVTKSEVKYFHVKQPIDHRVKRNCWLNLAIDCYSFMAAWKGQTFRSLDQITVSAYCKLRRIFTMRDKLIQFSNDDQAFEASNIQGGVFVPKGFQLNPDVIQTTQVIVYEPPEELPIANKQSTTGSLGSSSVKTTKKQPSHVMSRQDKKTVVGVHLREVPKPKLPESPQKLAIEKQAVQGAPSVKNKEVRKPKANTTLPKNTHIIPENRSDEQYDDLVQKDLKKQLERLDHKQKFQPLGKATKKVFLSDAQQLPISTTSSKQYREQLPAKTQLVKVKDYLQSHGQVTKPKKYEQNIEQLQQLDEKYEGDNFQEYEGQGFDDSLQRQQIEIEKQIKNMKLETKKLYSLFPTAVITKKNSDVVVAEVKGGQDIELVYDQMLECYYDPKTNQYYQIS